MGLFRKSSYDGVITLQRFRLLFRLADRRMLSERLGVGEKQVQRYLQGESDPTANVLAAMKALIDEQREDVALYGLLEQLRADAEKAQFKNPHLEIQGVEERDIPGWYMDVRNDIAERRYAEALLVLRQRRKYPDDWDRIPEKTKPYVLGSLGLAAYYTGRWSEAQEAFQAALSSTRAVRNDTPPLFLASYTCNLGLAYMRQVQYEKAFERFEECSHVLPSFIANYYNAICAASLMKSAEWVGHWSGRMAAAAKMASPSDILEVLETYKSDEDLVFARECDTFILAIESIMAIHSIAKKGDNNASR